MHFSQSDGIDDGIQSVGANKSSVSSSKRKSVVVILGLCLFIFLLSFKPSEPYLSQFLICNYNTQYDYCQSLLTGSETRWGGAHYDISRLNDIYLFFDNRDSQVCNPDDNPPCNYYSSVSNSWSCLPIPCSNVTSKSDCGDYDYSYCAYSHESHTCEDITCYKNFSADQASSNIDTAQRICLLST